jgi:glycerol-3-phosphate dehydrogenase
MGQSFSNPLILSQAEEDANDGTLINDSSILVLGGGNFGTCLADHLATLDNKVSIWVREPDVCHSINNNHVNSKYLSQYKLSPNLTATTELNQELFDQVSVVLFAIPTQYMRYISTYCRSTLEKIQGFVKLNHLLIFVNKGIEMSTGLLPNDIVTQVLGKSIGIRAAFLSGPSFAAEVITRQPTCVSVASCSKKRAQRTQALFHAPFFRVYDIYDPIGVEIAGALKNVIAIASGACSGAGFQMNARAAIITRGFVILY